MDPNSGPQACTPSTFPTEDTPNLASFLFKSWSLNSFQAPLAPAIAFVRAYSLQVSGCPHPLQSNQLSVLDL